jgi:Methyltransferase domain
VKGLTNETTDKATPTRWRHDWRTMGSGAPVRPYAEVYQGAVDSLPWLFENTRIHVVELGVFDGCSARIMIEQLERCPIKPAFRFTLIDPQKRVPVDELPQRFRSRFVEFIESTAEEQVDRFPDTSIHLLHIDTSPHTYEQHKRIHDLYAPKVVPGGIMIVHDCHPQYGTFKFVVDHLLTESTWAVTFVPCADEWPTSRPVVCRKVR